MGEEKSDRLRLLFDSIAEVCSTLDLEELLVRVVDRSLDLTGAEKGILILGGEVRVARGRQQQHLPLSVEYSHKVVERAIETGETEFSELDLEQSGEFPLSISVVSLGLRSVMCAPLTVENRTFGVLYLDSRVGSKNALTASDKKFFQGLAGVIAVAIENARLRDAELEKERLEERMRIAAQIQRDLLPDRRLEVEGFDIYGVSLPCEETGGDYLDYVDLPEGHIGIVVGDMEGKGLRAALNMLTARAHFRSALTWMENPVDVFVHLDRQLSRDLGHCAFMTLLLVDLDPVKRTIRFVTAGAWPPLLLRGGAFEELSGRGPAIALETGTKYTVTSPVPLEEGDILVLATDGIFEARKPGSLADTSRFFDDGQLRRTVRSLNDRPSEEIVTGVLAAVDEFTGGGERQDDQTLVVLKVVPGSRSA